MSVDFEDTDDTGVLPGEQVKALKASLKEAKGMAKLAKRDSSLGNVENFRREAARIESQLMRHKTLEDEARQLKATIKSTEARKEELVEQARLKISKDEARKVAMPTISGRISIPTWRIWTRSIGRSCRRGISSVMPKTRQNSSVTRPRRWFTGIAPFRACGGLFVIQKMSKCTLPDRLRRSALSFRSMRDRGGISDDQVYRGQFA